MTILLSTCSVDDNAGSTCSVDNTDWSTGSVDDTKPVKAEERHSGKDTMIKCPILLLLVSLICRINYMFPQY